MFAGCQFHQQGAPCDFPAKAAERHPTCRIGERERVLEAQRVIETDFNETDFKWNGHTVILSTLRVREQLHSEQVANAEADASKGDAIEAHIMRTAVGIVIAFFSSLRHIVNQRQSIHSEQACDHAKLTI